MGILSPKHAYLPYPLPYPPDPLDQLWGSTRGVDPNSTENDIPRDYRNARPVEKIASKSTPRSMTAMRGMDLTPQEMNLYRHHLEHLPPGERFQERNQLGQTEGTTSTIQQMTIERDGRVYNVPTIWHGRKIRGEELGKYIQPLSQWPSYDSEEEAERRYNEMHGGLEQDMIPTGDGDGDGEY